jgi:hypothetical protein
METAKLNPRLRLLPQIDIRGKVVLVRVDHNVVRSGLKPVEALLDRK